MFFYMGFPGTVHRPPTDRSTDRCKKCTDRTDRGREGSKLNPPSWSLQSVQFLQRSVERSEDGLCMVLAKPHEMQHAYLFR